MFAVSKFPILMHINKRLTCVTSFKTKLDTKSARSLQQ